MSPTNTKISTNQTGGSHLLKIIFMIRVILLFKNNATSTCVP